MSVPNEYKLTVKEDPLSVVIENLSATTLRLWEQTNSWGWGTLELSISLDETFEKKYTLASKAQIWTRNGPGYFDVDPGGSHLFEISTSDLVEDSLIAIKKFKNDALFLRAMICIPETPEAINLNVFMGKIISLPIALEPPHSWL